MNSNDQMMQQSMGDPSISGRGVLAPPVGDNAMNNNPGQMLQPPPNTILSMTVNPYPGLGGVGSDQQQLLQGPHMGVLPPPPPPPPRCQIANPFMGTPPLIPHDRVMQQQASNPGGPSSMGQQMDNTFGQDMRHRGYPGMMNLPPPFQVHPNLQSQIQAFQQDHMGQQQQQQQQQHMTQPPGFLQGFIPTEIVSAPDSRTSHLLQPHVRQRARRRSRANRASSIIQAHVYEAVAGSAGPDPASAAALGRSREMPPTAQITVDSGPFGIDTTADTDGAAARLEDAKLKGLEENYSSIGENFECNICFQKANEAVVTCCGHLFCWPCLYRWLHIHSYYKECPVCKGAIDESTITPIYGRECSALLSARGLPGGSAAERIPPRPPARRVESARQLREREDRGREREQRERALERERERERESETIGLAEVLRQGVVTAMVEEAGGGGMMRDNNSATSTAIQSVQDQAGDGGGGGDITMSSIGRQQEEIYSSGEHDEITSSGSESTHTPGPPGVNTASSSFQDLSTGGGALSMTQSQGGSMYGAAGGGGASTTAPTPTPPPAPPAPTPPTPPTPPTAPTAPTAPTTPTTPTTPAPTAPTVLTAPTGGGGAAPAFLQRRVSDRREQLRAALAASARSGTNSISSLADRVDERRQMIAAAALLSQEWEDIVNISRLVGPVNPVQAAAWMAAVQGRLGGMEGTSLDSLGGCDFPTIHQQQHGGGPGVMLHSQPVLHRPRSASSRHTIASPEMISQDGGSGGDDSTLSRLVTVNPLQAGDWLVAMRSRLTSMEKIVENLESPLQILPQHAHAPIAALLSNNNNNTNLPTILAQSHAQAGGLLQTTASASTTAALGLEDHSLLDGIQPSSVSNLTTTSMEGPSARAVEEQPAAAATSTATAAVSLPPSAAPATSSSTLGSNPVNSTRTQSEPRLNYREAPVPKPPSSSRRRSLRTGEEGSSMNNNNNNNNQGQPVTIGHGPEGTGCTGPLPEAMSSRSKRRRLD